MTGSVLVGSRDEAASTVAMTFPAFLSRFQKSRFVQRRCSTIRGRL
ncbi:hypothetical protein [Mesorhizobium australicum]|nr:hypothetical protein [Mesorhizobium australicum]